MRSPASCEGFWSLLSGLRQSSAVDARRSAARERDPGLQSASRSLGRANLTLHGVQTHAPSRVSLGTPMLVEACRLRQYPTDRCCRCRRHSRSRRGASSHACGSVGRWADFSCKDILTRSCPQLLLPLSKSRHAHCWQREVTAPVDAGLIESQTGHDAVEEYAARRGLPVLRSARGIATDCRTSGLSASWATEISQSSWSRNPRDESSCLLRWRVDRSRPPTRKRQPILSA